MTVSAAMMDYINLYSDRTVIYTVSLNNSAKYELILIIFGLQNPTKILHKKIINSLNSPVVALPCEKQET